MKPTQCPAKERKVRQEKQKKRGGEKAKSRSQDCCVTFKPKNYLKILLSVHAQTSQTSTLHLDRKATKCMTCKRLCHSLVSFSSLQQDSDQKTAPLASKLVFQQNLQGQVSQWRLLSKMNFVTCRSTYHSSRHVIKQNPELHVPRTHALCKVSCFEPLPSPSAPSLDAERNGHVQNNPAEELPGDLHRTRSFIRLKPINYHMNTTDCGFTYSTVASVTPFPLSQNPRNNIIPQVTRWKAYTCHFCIFVP